MKAVAQALIVRPKYQMRIVMKMRVENYVRMNLRSLSGNMIYLYTHIK